MKRARSPRFIDLLFEFSIPLLAGVAAAMLAANLDPDGYERIVHWRPFGDADLFGHPKGLTVLFATETWERFSYFGMSALVVLYMVKFLLLPGHVETVIGYGAVKTWLEFLFGRR